MADPVALQDAQALAGAGYQVAVGSWVQCAPALGLTTVLNAFNMLGSQQLELRLFDQAGNRAGSAKHSLGTHQSLRLDLETIVDPGKLPFEGCLWSWGKGSTVEGNLNFQGIDLDFIDRNQPTGHVMGSVHLITDFTNTLGLGPYIDLVCQRIMVESTPEGGQRYQNFLGLCFAPTNLFLGSTGNSVAQLVVTLRNESGDKLVSDQVISLSPMASWFGDLAVLFPELDAFLTPPGKTRGFGTLEVQEKSAQTIGMAGMVKVVDTLTGAMLVDHLNDRNFSRPAQKSAT
jgi:hypothetical protein